VYGIQFHPEDTPESGLEFLKSTKMYGTTAENFSRPEIYSEWQIFRNFVELIEH
jgi:GMP synthase-like glutamine amidotransferase